MSWLPALLALALSACTHTPPSPPEPEKDVCQSIGECDSLQAGISARRTVQLMVQSPMLIGGKAAEPGEWPASVYAKAGGSACSATLVGERVVFMAAHCMSNGQKITFTAGANSYSATCTHHPDYRKNDTADWALCLVSRPVTGVPFENLGLDAQLNIGQNLLLSGYGCVNPGGGGGNDGIFRIGEAKIRGLPAYSNHDIVTKGGAALCFGDSGGAAYLLGAEGARQIVAVNSRGDISTTSYLPSVRQKTFQDWAKSWATASNNVRLCGMHLDALGCRGGGLSPADPRFEISSPAACVKGAVRPDYIGRKNEIVEGLQKVIDIN